MWVSLSETKSLTISIWSSILFINFPAPGKLEQAKCVLQWFQCYQRQLTNSSLYSVMNLDSLWCNKSDWTHDSLIMIWTRVNPNEKLVVGLIWRVTEHITSASYIGGILVSAGQHWFMKFLLLIYLAKLSTGRGTKNQETFYDLFDSDDELKITSALSINCSLFHFYLNYHFPKH